MSTTDIDEAALREKAHAIQGLYADDPGGDGCYLNHGRDGQALCDAVTAELRRALADVARLTKERDEAVKEGRRDVLQFLREQANLVPLGAEDTRRGSSVYNWHLDAIQRVEHWLGLIKNRARAPSTPGSGGTVKP